MTQEHSKCKAKKEDRKSHSSNDERLQMSSRSIWRQRFYRRVQNLFCDHDLCRRERLQLIFVNWDDKKSKIAH